MSQPGRSLDLRDVMDQSRVLTVNLSKGRLGEDNSTLLGALLVTSIQQAATTRDEERRIRDSIRALVRAVRRFSASPRGIHALITFGPETPISRAALIL